MVPVPSESSENEKGPNEASTSSRLSVLWWAGRFPWPGLEESDINFVSLCSARDNYSTFNNCNWHTGFRGDKKIMSRTLSSALVHERNMSIQLKIYNWHTTHTNTHATNRPTSRNASHLKPFNTYVSKTMHSILTYCNSYTLCWATSYVFLNHGHIRDRLRTAHDQLLSECKDDLPSFRFLVQICKSIL